MQFLNYINIKKSAKIYKIICCSSKQNSALGSSLLGLLLNIPLSKSVQLMSHY